MTPQEMNDLLDLCCSKRIPVQLLFEGVGVPLHARFVEQSADAVTFELGWSGAELPDLGERPACCVSFQRGTRTHIFITRPQAGSSAVGYGRVDLARPQQVVIAQARQFFRVPVPENARLIVKVAAAEGAWQMGLPIDISLGGLGLSLLGTTDQRWVAGSHVRVHLRMRDLEAELPGTIARVGDEQVGLQFAAWETEDASDAPAALRSIVAQVEQSWIEGVFAP